MGSTALEEFPFPDLGFIATIAALLVALLILTTQRHQETLAEHRAQLTMRIAMLSERKIAKVIEHCPAAALGSDVEAYTDYGHWRVAYQSCREHCRRPHGGVGRPPRRWTLVGRG